MPNGFVTRCTIISRNEVPLFVQDEAGNVIAQLDDYAIIPMHMFRSLCGIEQPNGLATAVQVPAKSAPVNPATKVRKR